MAEQTTERNPHPLAIIAANLVRDSADRPGTWDFQAVFADHIALMDIRSRMAEAELMSSTEAAQESRILYLMKRRVELEEAAARLEAKLKKRK